MNNVIPKCFSLNKMLAVSFLLLWEFDAIHKVREIKITCIKQCFSLKYLRLIHSVKDDSAKEENSVLQVPN